MKKDLSSIFILIRSLEIGGAERQVSVLAQALHEKGYKVTVGVFYPGGPLAEKLQQAGVTIYSLNKKGRWDLIGWFRRYLKAVRDVNPDVIYSFLTTSNIVAATGQLFIRKPVVWGIRTSNMSLENYDGLARFTAWMERKLSAYVKTIIFNAQAGQKHHKTLGYCLNNAVVIPNGFDTNLFKPEAKVRAATRDQLGIPQDALVVGMLARVDPMKDFKTFVSAARGLAMRYPYNKLYFVVAGAGTDKASWGELPPHFLRLGVWEDVPALLNALDVMVLSSLGEGFPNVVGEAMACGIPTVVTHVGDAALIVGDQGRVAPVQDSHALCEAIASLVDHPPSKEEVRDRILSNFSIPQMVDKTLQTLSDACTQP